MILRVQFERHKGISLNQEEYIRDYQLNAQRLARAKPGALVFHPGPVNRGVEITDQVADGPASVILHQVTCGVAVRMAALSLCIGALDRERKSARPHPAQGLIQSDGAPLTPPLSHERNVPPGGRGRKKRGLSREGRGRGKSSAGA
jgi:hypothetical protein